MLGRGPEQLGRLGGSWKHHSKSSQTSVMGNPVEPVSKHRREEGNVKSQLPNPSCVAVSLATRDMVQGPAGVSAVRRCSVSRVVSYLSKMYGPYFRPWRGRTSGFEFFYWFGSWPCLGCCRVVGSAPSCLKLGRHVIDDGSNTEGEARCLGSAESCVGCEISRRMGVECA